MDTRPALTGRRTIVKALGLGWAAALAPVARAQKWPAKPVQVVVGFPPGTLPDVLGRMVADKMGRSLGQPLVVVDQPGAAGALAANAVARAAPDGYTLMVGVAASIAVAPHVFKSAAYDPTKAFVPIGLIQRSPYFITARHDVPFSNFAGMLDYARKNPGKLNFGTPGIATLHHLTWELLQQKTGVSMTHIPMQAPQMVTETLAGRIDLFMDSATSLTTSNVKAGKFKFIAMSGEKRMAAFPDVPTIAESGFPIYSAAFNGLVGPAGLPQEVVQIMNTELNRALASPEILERLAQEGVPVEGGVQSTPQQFGDLIRSEYARWGEVIKTANIKLE